MTNGEKIKEIFPNIDNRLDAKTGIMIVKWADNTTKFFKTSWWNAEYKEPTTKNDLGVDCIDRNKAYEIIESWAETFDVGTYFDNEQVKEIIMACANRIDELPTVTPIRPKGQWIKKGEDWICSCCNDSVCEIYDGKPWEHFCPNCGADMREVEK